MGYRRQEGLVRRLGWAFDPRSFKVHPIASPDEHERAQHYLQRFWRRLPEKKGQIIAFDRSWYGRVLVERVEGFATNKEWRRALRSFVVHSLKHARVLMVQKVAMKSPRSRIIGVESHNHDCFRRHQHCVAHGAGKAIAVDGDDLERMAMQVHGMRHHRLIGDHKLHPFTLRDHEGRHILRPSHIIDGP